MDGFFYYSGIVSWCILTPILLVIFAFMLFYWWNRVFIPSLQNLRFAFFGKSKKENRSYYELWYNMYRWGYHYYYHGRGKGCFSRLAMRRLIMEARRESKLSGRMK